jgi:hypothetical protein
MLDTLEVLNVGRDEGCREIVHALIETGMKGNLDSFGF